MFRLGCGAVNNRKYNDWGQRYIGANAVVLKDVPDNSIAIGVPAEIKARRVASN